jgi:hypothetical protein
MQETLEATEVLEVYDVMDEGDDDTHSGKIYCANCIHCKLVPSRPEGDERYFLRVRCAAGKWKKKLGEEKVYKYCTVARRSIRSCDKYEEMGESKDFIRDLKKSLPVKDELYIY